MPRTFSSWQVKELRSLLAHLYTSESNQARDARRRGDIATAEDHEAVRNRVKAILEVFERPQPKGD